MSYEEIKEKNIHHTNYQFFFSSIPIHNESKSIAKKKTTSSSNIKMKKKKKN
jgi:hypothetical protein